MELEEKIKHILKEVEKALRRGCQNIEIELTQKGGIIIVNTKTTKT